MPLSEAQLQTWQNLPQTQTAIKAHEDIRTSIFREKVWLWPPDIYLQGSYVNDTSTSYDRDVDIVCQVNKDALFSFDIDGLSYPEQERFRQVVQPPSVNLQAFKSEVIGIFNRRFGYDKVEIGNKAVRVAGAPGVKLNADIIVCNHYRRYVTFSGDMNVGYIEGILFADLQGNRIINYPKLHKANGVTKQTQTGQWFKPSVRVFKNARSYMVENGILEGDVAPSYFIQGLLYNVDPRFFGGNSQQNFINILSWLVNNYSLWPEFMCQNGIDRLFGESQEQWETTKAVNFLSALLKLNS